MRFHKTCSMEFQFLGQGFTVCIVLHTGQAGNYMFIFGCGLFRERRDDMILQFSEFDTTSSLVFPGCQT